MARRTSAIDRFRGLAKAKQARRRIAVTIGEETFPFRLGFKAQGDARKQGEPDPVAALGRVVQSLAAVFREVARSPVVRRLLDAATEVAAAGDEAARAGLVLRAMVGAGMASGEVTDETEVADLYAIVFGEIAGEVGTAIISEMTGEFLDDVYTVLLWGLRDTMPSLTRADVEGAIEIPDLPKVVSQLVGLLFERQSPDREAVADTAKNG